MKLRFNTDQLLLGGGILARALLLFAGASEQSKELFIPFLRAFIENPLANPWAQFPATHFPYGIVLLLIIGLPALLVFKLTALSVSTSMASLAILKLPLFALDWIFLRLLQRIFPFKKRSILIYYWLNPITLYISFVVFQFDIAVTFFCFTALYLLTRSQIRLSAVLFAAACLCKFNVIVILPLLAAYIWNRDFIREALSKLTQWLSVFLPLLVLGLWPTFRAGHLGHVTFLSPEAARVFGGKLLYHQNVGLFVGVAILLIILGRLCLSSRLTDRGLIFGSGLLLSLLILITDPSPGWYFWPIPFISAFFALYHQASRLLYSALALTFIIHFAFLPHFVSVEMPLYSLSLTLLHASLAGILISFWSISLKADAPIERRSRPLAIGVCGDSGSGKNTLCSVLEKLYGKADRLLVEGDDYHRWERHDSNWQKTTHLNPEGNKLHDLSGTLRELLRGSPVRIRKYDHQSGKFTEPQLVDPGKTIFVQGLHTFYLRSMRTLLDLKIFLSPDPELRLKWKIDRDQRERGHSAEEVTESLKKREGDSARHIEPQKKWADWIIEVHQGSPVHVEHLKVRHTVWNDVPLEALLNEVRNSKGMKAQVLSEIGSEDRNIVEFEGHLSSSEVRAMAHRLFSPVRQILGSRFEPEWASDYHGISQLVYLTLMNRNVSEGKLSL